MRALFLLPLCLATPAVAMLSPWYDSAEKISAILQSGAVADAVHQAPIGAVSSIGTADNGNDLWQVRVQDCDLTVELIANPPPEGMVGKITYAAQPVGACE